MARWQVDIEKELFGEYWTNRYIVEGATMGAADLIGADITAIERTIHGSEITFTKRRTSDGVPGTDTYMVVPLNVNGTRTNATGEALPLFNVFRVDFQATAGRPSRKYIRGPVFEGDQAGGDLLAGTMTFINTNYAAPLAALTGYVDVDGQELLSGAVQRKVGMRQLRRGSKRRLLPIL
jgi:hypothetical protein